MTETLGNYVLSQNSPSRTNQRLLALGLKGQTWDLFAGGPGAWPGTAPNSGFVFGTLAGFLNGDVVTNLCAAVSGAGTGTVPTGIYMGLYSLSGSLLASTANLASSAVWTTGNAIAVCALQTPFTVQADGGMFIALLQNGAWGTSAMSVYGDPNATVGSLAAVSGAALAAVAQSGQTTLPSPATFTSQGRNNWYGWN